MTKSKSGALLDLVNIGLTWALVNGGEECVDLIFFSEPSSHAAELITKSMNGCLIHVGLSDKFRHRD
jgi:hypothetical protein